MLVPCTCPGCGKTAESLFHWAGVQVGRCCIECGQLVDYIARQRCCSSAEYRSEIWQVVSEDKSAIEKAKKMCGFIELKDELYRILQYNKLLITILKNKANGTNRL